MAGKARKMVNIDIDETSGVDPPAHLHEGWLVMKAASATDVDALIDETLTDLEAEMNPEQTQDEAPEVVAEETLDDVVKAAPEPLRKAMEEMQKALDETKAELRKEREERADAEAIAKARDEYANLGIDAEQVGPALRRLADTDADLAKSVEEILKAANAKVESADIFAEIGSGRPANSTTAFEKATSMAKSLVESGVAPTIEQAMTDVWSSNPTLYTEHLAEMGN